MLDGRVPLFRAYDDGYMQLDDRKLLTGFVLHHGEVTAPWGPERLADVTPGHLTHIFATPPEVLLIGTGRRTNFPAGPVMQALDDAHIGYEFMDSRAAARTYNILVEEGRDVSVAMLLPEPTESSRHFYYFRTIDNAIAPPLYFQEALRFGEEIS